MGKTVIGYTEVRELDYRVGGRTVLARREATGDEVVIRYLPPHAGGGAYREQLRRQVARLSTVDSPYLVGVRELVEDAEVCAVVLESPGGAPLHAVLADQGVVTVEAAMYLLRGSLCGLAAVHAAGVVHGGYRPEAVVIGTDGRVRLIDFGLVGDVAAGGPAGGPAGVSATADVRAAVRTFVDSMMADETFTSPADLIAASPVTLRELVRTGLSASVDAVALLAMLDEVALARYGTGWTERGRLWLAVRAQELRVEELRVEAEHDAVLVAEQRLRDLRAEELRVRTEWTEELRAAGLLAAIPVPAGPAVASLVPLPWAPRPALRVPASPPTPPQRAGSPPQPAGSPSPPAGRRGRNWLAAGIVLGLLFCGGLFAFWFGTGQPPARAGGGSGPTQPAVPAGAASPSVPPSPAGSPAAPAWSPAPDWSPAPPYSPVPGLGRG